MATIRLSTMLMSLAWLVCSSACTRSSSGSAGRTSSRLTGSAAAAPPDESKLSVSDGSVPGGFGQALASSGDLLVSTAPSTQIGDQTFAGAAYLFQRDQAKGQWIEQRQIVPQDIMAFEQFGLNVSLDGDTLAVGAPNAEVGGVLQQGAVYIFERNQGGADQWGEVLELSDASVGVGGHFGASLALAGDLLVVGATMPPALFGGKVAIFERDRGGPNAWGRVSTINDSDVGDGGEVEAFGSALALEGDLLLVGAESADVSYYDENDGAAYLFSRDPLDRDRWSLVARLAAAEALACTGGATLSDLATKTPDALAEARRCARQDSRSDNDHFGASVSLRGDTAAVGALSAESADGSGFATDAVYLFRRDPTTATTWTQAAKMYASDADQFNYFGAAVALSSDTLLVGAKGATVDSKRSEGAAYVFQRDAASGGWHENRKLRPSDGLSNAGFGSAVAIQDNTLLLGAPGQQGGLGAVYLYRAPSQSSSRCQPPFELNAELSEAGMITDASGVRLGAVQGALPGPVRVWVHEVGAPTEPLFNGATPVGAYYSVGSECTTFAPRAAPFVLALPVPEGADVSHLAVAELTPAKYLLDGPVGGEFWEPVQGIYDAQKSAYLVTLATLAGEGTTFVLIDHPDLAPLDLTVPSLAARSRSVDAKPLFYYARCVGFPSGGDCGSSEVDRVQAELLAADHSYRDLGFSVAGLFDYYALFESEEDVFHLQRLPYKKAFIRSAAEPECHPEGGRYHHIDDAITICLPAGGIPSNAWLRYVVRHQMFHAIQFGYGQVRSSLSQALSNTTPWDPWLIEGTADAAVESDTVMRRTAGGGAGLVRSLRPVDVRLTDERTETTTFPYDTQDFWVYLFQSHGRAFGLSELDSVFQLGASTASLAAWFDASKSLAFGRLGAEYWGWVRNQVNEKQVTFDGALLSPCRLELGLIGRGSEDNPDILWPASNKFIGELQPLQARAVKIELTAPAHDVTVSAEGGGPDVFAYKVYVPNEPACADPGVVPDSQPRTFQSLDKGAVLYVIVASLQYQGSALPPLYQVSISGGPG